MRVVKQERGAGNMIPLYTDYASTGDFDFIGQKFSLFGRISSAICIANPSWAI
jgi:hypothetical protein